VGPLKVALCGRIFTSNEKVKEAVHIWLREKPKSFPAGIQKIVERYNKCIVLQGDYVEKLYVKLLTVTSTFMTRTGRTYLYWTILSLSLSPILTFVFNVEYLATLSSNCLLNGDPVTNAVSSDIGVMAMFEGPFILGAKTLIWGVKNV
jgi:hypothetical protein